jgi:hypothetical protein
VLLAAALCGGTAWGIEWLGETRLHGAVLHMLALFAAIGAAMLVYAGAAYALRISETTEALNLVRRRLGRRPARA